MLLQSSFGRAREAFPILSGHGASDMLMDLMSMAGHSAGRRHGECDEGDDDAGGRRADDQDQVQQRRHDRQQYRMRHVPDRQPDECAGPGDQGGRQISQDVPADLANISSPRMIARGWRAAGTKR